MIFHATAFHNFNQTICFRSAICRSFEDCQARNVLGVANEASMCRDHSCAVVKDTGLGTSFTIAHEIGHVYVHFFFLFRLI